MSKVVRRLKQFVANTNTYLKAEENEIVLVNGKPYTYINQNIKRKYGEEIRYRKPTTP